MSMNFDSDTSISDESKGVRVHDFLYPVADSRGCDLHCQDFTLAYSQDVAPPPEVFPLLGKAVPLLYHLAVVALLTQVSETPLCG